MKKLLITILIAAVIAVQVICFAGCGGLPKLYNKSFEFTGKTAAVPWDEISNDSCAENAEEREQEYGMTKREQLQKYFDSIDWEKTQNNFEANGYDITITESAMSNVDGFIAFIEKATENIYSDLYGLKIEFSGSFRRQAKINYPNGKEQIAELTDGGALNEKEKFGRLMGVYEEDYTLLEFEIVKDGDQVRLNMLLNDDFSIAQTGSPISAPAKFVISGTERDLIEINIYPEYK